MKNEIELKIKQINYNYDGRVYEFEKVDENGNIFIKIKKSYLNFLKEKYPETHIQEIKKELEIEGNLNIKVVK